MKKLYETDPYLMPYKEAILARHERIMGMKRHIAGDGLLKDAVNNHMYYGLHRCDDGSWIFREWAPNATKIYLVGDFNNWKRTDAYALPSCCSMASCTSCTSSGPAGRGSAFPRT